MKVLFISNSIGGLRNFRYELIEALRKRGDDVFILSPLESSAQCFEDLGCVIKAIELNRKGVNPFAEVKLLYQYYNIIKEVNPDVALAYTIKPNIYGSVVCRWLGIPIIANITGLGEAVEGGGVIAFVTKQMYKWGLKKTDFVYFQNEEILRFFHNNKIKALNTSLIPGSGVNLEKFGYEEYPEENGENHFLYVGRILKEKGIQQFLECSECITKKYPNTYFHIVGIKDDVKYSAMVDDFHNKGIIIFHGQQTDVRPFLKKIHCLLHPSFYPEGMSNVLLECAATGRPAITTDKSGCKEVVDDNVTGYIVAQQSSPDLIEKVERFINLSYAEKCNMGQSARRRVEKTFDRKKVVAEYLYRIGQLYGSSK